MGNRTKTTVLAVAIFVLAAQAWGAQCTQPGHRIYGAQFGDSAQGLVLNNFTPDTETLAGSLIATDLTGAVTWTNCENVTYTRPASPTTILTIAGGDSVQEISTTAVVWTVEMSYLNQQLGRQGLLQLLDFDHEAIRLPNGWTAIIGHVEELVDCTEYPTQCPTGPTVGNDVDILGSAVVVVDTTGTIQWYWNPFLSLDIARAAILGETCTPHTSNGGCPIKLAPEANDWTHSNSLWFDPADNNLVLNIRNQDWTVKLDFNNGLGTGDIIWHLGNEGDFVLQPTSVVWPWFSHAHDVTSYAPGFYTFFDNGNTRVAPPPVGLGPGDSRGQAYSIDEVAMTATLIFSQDLGVYSPGSGTSQELSNGNYWFMAGRPEDKTTGNTFSRAFEITPAGTVVYQQSYTVKQYRASRFATLFTF